MTAPLTRLVAAARAVSHMTIGPLTTEQADKLLELQMALESLDIGGPTPNLEPELWNIFEFAIGHGVGDSYTHDECARGLAYVGAALRDAYLRRNEDAAAPTPTAPAPTDPLDINTPIEEVDAELRAMGVDPEALAARGQAFVAGVKAEIAGEPDAKALQDICNEAFGQAIQVAALLKLSGADAGAMGRDAENRAIYNRGLADMRARCVALLAAAANERKHAAIAALDSKDADCYLEHNAAGHALEEAAAAVEALGAEERTR